MALRVVCFSSYLTTIGGWRGVDHDAHDFIDAIKDRSINGYSRVPVRGRRRFFDNDNRQDIVGWFAEMVSDHFTAEPVDGPIVLVPVPGSKVSVAFAGMPRTAQLAQAIATELNDGRIVKDALRWREPMPSANEDGGTRDPAELFNNLVLIENVDGDRVVLVDDVLTSGGHLQACAEKLRAGGAEVLMAVVAGRADENQVDDPFALRSADIGDYEP